MGNTWHATGLMGILKPSQLETRIAVMSRDMFPAVGGEMGGTLAFNSVWQPVCGQEERQNVPVQEDALLMQCTTWSARYSLLTRFKEYCGLVKTEDLQRVVFGSLEMGGQSKGEICLALGCEAIDKGCR